MPALDSVSILVVSWDGREHLESCLPALLEQRPAGVEVEIRVLDNGSVDGSADFVRERFPTVRLERTGVNLGFAAGNNRLARGATGDAVVLVNNDTRAESDWLAALVDTYRRAPDDVAAVAGTIVDWQAERLDFGHGIMTFDGHALAVDQGRPVAQARRPRADEPLFFGCGGNLMVRKASFLAAGGFDERFFAYFEDVDLGWRLWSGGERILACPEAVVRHRLSATSSRLGNRVRGALFERNAIWTMVKNLEDDLRSSLLPAILLTFLARLEAMLAAESGHAARLLRGTAGGAPGDGELETALAKVRRLGPGQALRRGTARWLRSLAGRLIGQRSARLEIAGDRSLAQLQALGGLLAQLDAVEADRARVAARRRRSDRELFEQFPLWIVPTYPGDERLFSSAAFTGCLPADLRFERAPLNEVLGAG